MDILLVEDHADLAANVGEFLERRGHRVDYAGDGLTGLRLARLGRFDALILDRVLPGLDGASLCRRLREGTSFPVPVLMLTALDTTRDKLDGFAAGADDYLVKPFALAELAARLEALHRRAHSAARGRVLQVGELRYDLDRLTVTRGGRRVDLTPAARRLLEVLMRASPRALTRDELERALWGDQPPASDALRTHLHSLRRAIDRDQPRRLLQTVHGFGYRLATDD